MLASCAPAQAILFSGAGGAAPPPSGTVLTTLTLVNTSASIVPANSISPSIGHSFKKGDVPTGTWPQLQLTDGTAVPCTIYNRIFWTDGSLQHCGLLPRIPVSIAASGTLTINVMNGGTTPASSARSTADLTAGGLNLIAEVTGQANLTGVWQSILANGVSNIHQSFLGEATLVYGDGPVGRIVRIRASFEQSNAAHGQLEGYWWVYILQDSSGGIYGIRYLPSVMQPWYNNDTPAKKFRVFSSALVKNGVTTLLDTLATGYPAATTITATSGNADIAVASTAGLRRGLLCFLTGTPPTGFSTGTPYWIVDIKDATHVWLSAEQGNIGAHITPTSSQACTATFYPYVSHFGAETFTDADAKYLYVQGAGSVAAEATLRWQWNKAYIKSTKVIPSFDLTVSPTSSASVDHWWNNVDPATPDIDSTGERGDIGIVTTWNARHFLTQATVDERNVRVLGLVGMTFPWWVRETTTKSMPNGRNTAYTGMPTANANFRWPVNPGITPVGFTTESPAATCIAQSWHALTFSHAPECVGYAYLFTAEPHLMEAAIVTANGGLIQRATGNNTPVANATNNKIYGERTITISAVRYDAPFCDQERSSAWSGRSLYLGALFAKASPETPDYKTYLMDTWHDLVDGLLAFTNMNTIFWKNNGVFQCWGDEGAGENWGPWVNGYWLQHLAWGYALTEYANAKTLGDHCAKWYKYAKDNFGGWCLGAFEWCIRTGIANDAPIITVNSQFGVTCGLNPSWVSGGQFTVVQQNGYVLKNNDIVLFDNNGTIPAGFSGIGTPYYVVNANAGISKCDLSATLGGSPIALTNTGSANGNTFTQDSLPSTTTWAVGNNGIDGYGSNTRGTLALMTAVGFVVDAVTLTDVQGRFNGYGMSYTSNPKYSFVNSA